MRSETPKTPIRPPASVPPRRTPPTDPMIPSGERNAALQASSGSANQAITLPPRIAPATPPPTLPISFQHKYFLKDGAAPFGDGGGFRDSGMSRLLRLTLLAGQSVLALLYQGRAA